MNEAFATYGVTVTTNDQAMTHVGTGGSIQTLIGGGAVTPTVDGQTWYSDINAGDSGDGVVPLVSLQSTFFGDPHITIKQWGTGPAIPDLPFTHATGDIDHNSIIKNADVDKWIVDELTGG